MLSQLLRLVPRPLKNRLKRRFSVPDMEWSLRRMRKAGFNPRRVLDVGAYRGEWTTLCKSVFPEARVLMIEALDSQRSHLERVSERFRPDVAFEIQLLAAAATDDLEYFENETATSALPEWEGGSGRRRVASAKTLDQVLRERGWDGADFLKLDVQGYELEILKGGAAAISGAEAALMEVSLIEIYRGSPLLAEAVEFMRKRDFQVHDVCSLIRRPFDDALWQMDLVFVRAGSPLLESKRWG